MSTYLQRTRALLAAALLALAVGFGLACTQQAYAAEGGGLQVGGLSTQAYVYPNIVVAPLVDNATGESVEPADYSVSAEVYYTSSTKSKKFWDGDLTKPKAVDVTLTATQLTKHQNADGVEAYWVGIGIPAVEGDQYAVGFGTYSSDSAEFAADNNTSSFTEDGTTYNTFYFGSYTSLAGKTAYVAVKPAANPDQVTVYDINLKDTYTDQELPRGLYEVSGLEIDTGMVNLDTDDAKTYIKVDDGVAKLLVRIYNANKYDYIYVSDAASRPDSSATDQMTEGYAVPADADYIENGAKKSQILTDATGIYGAADMKYKAMYYELPITQAMIANKSVPVNFRRTPGLTNKGGEWMGDSDHFLTFTDYEAVDADSDLIDCSIDTEDTVAAIFATNLIPFEPTSDDIQAYCDAWTAYGELDYSDAYYDRAYLDQMIPEVKAKIEAADAAIPNVVPEDGTYEFTQSLRSYNYPSIAQGLYSDSLYSGILTVKDGKMTIQVAQRRGTYYWAYLGFPTEAAAELAAAGKDVTKMSNTYSYQNESQVYLDHAAGTIGPDGDRGDVDTAGVYGMYTATFEIASLEKPVAIACISKANASGTWYNRSFIFHEANLFTTDAIAVLRSINGLLNAPDQEDPATIYPVYKVDTTLITEDDKDAIEAARAAYEALGDSDKARLGATMVMSTPDEATDGQTYVEALEAAEKYFSDKEAAEQKAVADAAAASAATKVISVLPSKVTSANEAAIAKARAAYNALTADQKALVSASDLAKLTNAEKQIAALKKVTKVTVNVATVKAAAITKAITKAGGDAAYVKTVVLGKKVKKIAKNTFKNFKNVTTVQVTSTKIKKASSVKNCFKGSKVTTVKVPKAKLKAYKKIFTKKITGAKKLTVKK